MRAEARGGEGEGILGWHRRAISVYTWCASVTEKGPPRKWLHNIGKEDTPGWHCQTGELSRRHVVESYDGGEEKGRRGRDGGVAGTPLEKQKEGERRCWG